MQDTGLPLAELVRKYPQVEVFLRSLNMPNLNYRYSLEKNLSSRAPAEFLEASMGREEMLSTLQLLCDRLAESAAHREKRLQSLTILGGHDKDGKQEDLALTLVPGDTVTLVGPTGSGKSRLLEDIESLAEGDTPSGRRILLDGAPPDPALRWQGDNRMVAQLSQNMNFVMDLSVQDFLTLHQECRNRQSINIADVISAANALAGEAILPEMSLTQLSGGQSRALMIADTALLSAAPVVLIDEIENAGIDRKQALSLLAGEDKIVLISTLDPLLALLGKKRLVIANGAVSQILETSPAEQKNLAILEQYDEKITGLRQLLRKGGRVDMDMEAYLWEKDHME